MANNQYGYFPQFGGFYHPYSVHQKPIYNQFPIQQQQVQQNNENIVQKFKGEISSLKKKVEEFNTYTGHLKTKLEKRNTYVNELEVRNSKFMGYVEDISKKYNTLEKENKKLREVVSDLKRDLGLFREILSCTPLVANGERRNKILNSNTCLKYPLKVRKHQMYEVSVHCKRRKLMTGVYLRFDK